MNKEPIWCIGFNSYLISKKHFQYRMGQFLWTMKNVFEIPSYLIVKSHVLNSYVISKTILQLQFGQFLCFMLSFALVLDNIFYCSNSILKPSHYPARAGKKNPPDPKKLFSFKLMIGFQSGPTEAYRNLLGFTFFLTYFGYYITRVFQSGRADYAYDDIGLSLLDLKMFHRPCFYVKLGGRILFCSLMTGKYGRSWTNYKQYIAQWFWVETGPVELEVGVKITLPNQNQMFGSHYCNTFCTIQIISSNTVNPPKCLGLPPVLLRATVSCARWNRKICP